MHSELSSILSAEQYDDGRRFHAIATARANLRKQPHAIVDEDHTPRKRSKTQPPNDADADPDGSKKRSRGRPRLDTKDETAADRRRTQIRLAQRAYRNRKETAIQTLEKRVQQLLDNNEEMSTAFTDLLDFAVRQGVFETTPEFGRQLKATTEKFLRLARRSSEDAARDEDGAGGGPDSSPIELEGGDRASRGASSQSPDTTDAPGSNVASGTDSSALPRDSETTAASDMPRKAMQLYGGIIMTEETHTDAALDAATDAAFAATFGSMPTTSAPEALGYEIITQPTADNASFPWGISLDTDMTDFLDPVSSATASTSILAPAMTAAALPSPLNAFSSPLIGLSMPTSYSYQERTFGRRLQRAAVEQGLKLMLMPNPPPHLYAAIFGFCLLFESRDKIIERLSAALSRGAGDSLHHWRHPFLHLGGAGTFFDDLTTDPTKYDETNNESRRPVTGTSLIVRGSRLGSDTELPIGNQGTTQLFQPADHRAQFSMGPWGEEVEQTKDTRVDDKMRVLVPEFQGEFFDTDEVEYYFRERDIVIPQGADFVRAIVDLRRFARGEEVSRSSHSTKATTPNGGSEYGFNNGPNNLASTTATANMSAMAVSSLLLPAGDTIRDMWEEADKAEADEAAKSSNTADGVNDTVIDPVFSSTTFPGMASSSGYPSVDSTTATAAGQNLLDSGGLLGFSMPSTRPSMSEASNTNIRQVTVNVETLVKELIKRSVCLGRSPGIRPKDVNTAFWAAVSFQ